MRPRILLTLVLSWLVVFAFTEPLPAQPKKTGTRAIGPEGYPVLKFTGTWQPTEADAWNSARIQAQQLVTDYFIQEGTPLTTAPSPEDVWPKLVKNLKPDEPKDFEDVGRMHRYTGEIHLTPSAKADLLKKDRQVQVKQRMVWLGKMLAALVVVLAAASGYLRLDDMTKGYYTAWLRVAALGFVGTGVVGLLLFA